MDIGQITIERQGFLSWRVWARPTAGYTYDESRFTRRGALYAGRRWLKQEARRVASRETTG